MSTVPKTASSARSRTPPMRRAPKRSAGTSRRPILSNRAIRRSTAGVCTETEPSSNRAMIPSRRSGKRTERPATSSACRATSFTTLLPSSRSSCAAYGSTESHRLKLAQAAARTARHLPHHAEVDERQSPRSLAGAIRHRSDEDIARMRVGVEETLCEQLVEHHRGENRRHLHGVIPAARSDALSVILIAVTSLSVRSQTSRTWLSHPPTLWSRRHRRQSWARIE